MPYPSSTLSDHLSRLPQSIFPPVHTLTPSISPAVPLSYPSPSYVPSLMRKWEEYPAHWPTLPPSLSPVCLLTNL